MFDELGDFKDARRQAEFYKNKAGLIFDSSLDDYFYEHLVNRLSKFNTDFEKEEILNAFKEISDYKDSKKYIAALEYEDPTIIEDVIENLKREKDSLMLNNNEIKEVQELISSLKIEFDEELEKEKNIFTNKKNVLEKEIGEIRQNYLDTLTKLSSCSIFAIKEKKILRDRISTLEIKLIEIKRQNEMKLQALECEFNNKCAILKSSYNERIDNCEKRISEIISSDPQIKRINQEILTKEAELQSAKENKDRLGSSIKLWDTTNIRIFYDYYGFKILTFKLGKYPQSKVSTPSLIKELKLAAPDEKGIYHLHGLEFYEIKKVFYLIEPIEWKIIKCKQINGSFHYLLISKNVLEIKGAINPENVIKMPRDCKTFKYFTKKENEFVSLYKYSDIRKWLINTFYEFAFNENEKRYICTAHLDNSAESTSDETTIFVTEDTDDKIFLLSYRACKKTHFGDDFYENIFNKTIDEMRSHIIERENSIVDDVLIPSFGLKSSDISHKEYFIEKNQIYEDPCELCWSDVYSDYAFELRETTRYQEGALLRSPDTVDVTGYNRCNLGHIDSYGGQFEDGNFDITNDVLPCLILCLNENEDIVKPDADFDF